MKFLIPVIFLCRLTPAHPSNYAKRFLNEVRTENSQDFDPKKRPTAEQAKCMGNVMAGVCEEVSAECQEILSLGTMCESLSQIDLQIDLLRICKGIDMGNKDNPPNPPQDQAACESGEGDGKCKWIGEDTRSRCTPLDECNKITDVTECTKKIGCAPKGDDCQIFYSDDNGNDDSGGGEGEGEEGPFALLKEDPKKMCESGCMQVMVDMTTQYDNCGYDKATTVDMPEMIDAMCAQNFNDEYCVDIYSAIGKDDEAKMCQVISNSACCLGTAANIVLASGNITSKAAMDADLRKCGINSDNIPLACPKPGEKQDVVEVDFTVDLDYAGVAKMSAAERLGLRNVLAKGLAKDADVDVSQISIKFEKDGLTTKVKAGIAPTKDQSAADIIADIAKDLGSSINSTAVAESVEGTSAESKSGKVDIGTATASKVEVTNDKSKLVPYDPENDDTSAAFALVPAVAIFSALF